MQYGKNTAESEIICTWDALELLEKVDSTFERVVFLGFPLLQETKKLQSFFRLRDKAAVWKSALSEGHLYGSPQVPDKPFFDDNLIYIFRDK